MYFILFYETVSDYLTRRAEFREKHLELARQANLRGELVMAGAFSDPADGAVLIFRSDSPDVAENFALNDPYVINGLIRKWYVRPWTVVIGNE